MNHLRLYLIGYRGTGKTTVGQFLAQRIGWSFVDADVVLEERAGRTIKGIFAAEGEAGFREREAQNLKDLSRQPECVIATGGGIILREDNRRLLNETGYVVWLTAPVDVIAARVAADPSTCERRPNLTVGGNVEIADLLAQREPLYRACAELEIDTAGRSPENVVERILTQWNPSSARPSG